MSFSGFFSRAVLLKETKKNSLFILLFSLSLVSKKKKDDYLDVLPISKKNNYTRVAVSS